MAPNGFPGGQGILMLVPLILIGAAVWVLAVALRDQGGRPRHSLPRLPDPNSHPLHHVRVSMASTKRKATVAARRAQAPPPGVRGGRISGLSGGPAAALPSGAPAPRSVRSFEHSLAHLADVDIHYVRQGRGAPLVLLHGWPEFWRVWRKVIEPLSRDFDVVAPDLRGFGASSKPARPALEGYRLEDHVGDVLSLSRRRGRSSPRTRPSSPKGTR